MKEELVSFETSKLLKEKGFDEVWCNHIYCIGYNTIPEDNELLECDWRNNVKGQFHLALAPTQALAQKWLREKHSIHIAIMPAIIPSNEIKYYVYRGKKSWDWSELYNTYEEATEAALLYALKNFINEKTE